MVFLVFGGPFFSFISLELLLLPRVLISPHLLHLLTPTLTDHVTNAIPAGWLAHFHVEGGGRADAAETGAGRERGWGQDAAKATG